MSVENPASSDVSDELRKSADSIDQQVTEIKSLMMKLTEARQLRDDIDSAITEAETDDAVVVRFEKPPTMLMSDVLLFMKNGYAITALKNRGRDMYFSRVSTATESISIEVEREVITIGQTN